MIKDITDAIKNILSRFKGVNYVKYQGDDLNNQQHNNKTIQCYIDTIQFHQFNLTNNICKVEYQIYILGYPDNNDPDSVLNVQDTCFDVAVYTLAYIDNIDEYKGFLRVYDYSILTLDRYSEESNAGVKLSVVLEYPNPVNLCILEDKFNEEPYTPEQDTEIDVDTTPVSEELIITPIKLPKNRDC